MLDSRPARRSHLLAVFQKRLRAVRRELADALGGEAESVHRMRVASRRLREALPVLTLAGTDRADMLGRRKLRRKVRRLTRALGGVREMDVALATLEEFRERSPSLVTAIEAVRALLERERAARRVEMLRRLEAIDLRALGRKITTLVAAFDLVADDCHRHLLLGARIGNRVDGLEAAVEAAGTMYAADRLHAVRIAAKKLRYALELARELARVPTLALTRRLKEMQDLLGRLHDLEVLAGHARGIEGVADTSEELRASAGDLVIAIEGEIVRLHAGYVSQRKVLSMVVGRCRRHVCPRLSAAQSARAAPDAGLMS
jgi:CHAD domain-containing protein